MELILLSALKLAQEFADSRFAQAPTRPMHHDVSFWWVIVAALVIIALCWFILSVMKKGSKASLWKDKRLGN